MLVASRPLAVPCFPCAQDGRPLPRRAKVRSPVPQVQRLWQAVLVSVSGC
jgi:hypothetical protein